MRRTALLVTFSLVSAFAYGQDVVLKHERFQGHIEKSADGLYSLILEDNLRIQLTSLPQALVDKHSTPVDLFLTIPEAKSSEPAATDSPDDRPSLVMLSLAELTRRERLQQSGKTAAWSLTDVDLPEYEDDQPHCKARPGRVLSRVNGR